MEPTPDTRTDDGLAAPRNADDGNDAAGAVGRGHRAGPEASAPVSSAEDAALDALGALADPVRRALYRYVAAASGPVGRAEAAEAVGVGRTLAAHHLDRLVDAGFLDAEFARPAGRGGPGAGRPAKVYRRAAGRPPLRCRRVPTTPRAPSWPAHWSACVRMPRSPPWPARKAALSGRRSVAPRTIPATACSPP
ncbi:helix-turn-helix domain-containing protein [Yinghuangia aomiensis]